MKSIKKIILSAGIIVFVGLIVVIMLFNGQLFAANRLNADMISVKGGTFIMGATEDKKAIARTYEFPAHEVTVDNFSISRYLVTVKQFSQFVEETGYLTDAEKGTGILDGETGFVGSWVLVDGISLAAKGVTWRCKYDGTPWEENQTNYPVVHVSWNDANAYCEWLTHKNNRIYRLPTEAEWEYAAGGGRESADFLYSGSNVLNDVGWFLDNSADSLMPVGEKNPNELGIYDMSGLVWEWCNDYYDLYTDEPQNNPVGPLTGENRVTRGGSVTRFQSECTILHRNYFLPYNRGGGVGFRVVSHSN